MDYPREVRTPRDGGGKVTRILKERGEERSKHRFYSVHKRVVIIIVILRPQPS